MSTDLTYAIASKADIYPVLTQVGAMVDKGLPGGPVELVLRRPGRSTSQSAKFHAMIGDIHKQCFRGYSLDGVKAVLVNQFSIELEEHGDPLANPGEKVWDWKTKEPVYVRPTTTKFRKSEASAFVEFLFSVGSEYTVTWSEKALKEYEQYKEAKT